MFALPPQTFRWIDPDSWPWVFYVWIVMIGAGYIPELWRIWRQQSAKFWLPVSATIDSTHVDAAPNRFLQIGRRSAQFQANLNYSFSVGGTTYTGQYSRMFYTEAEALEFIRDLWGKTLNQGLCRLRGIDLSRYSTVRFKSDQGPSVAHL